MIKEEGCENCRFWEEKDGYNGECRIDPPKIIPGLKEFDDDDEEVQALTGFWPETKSYEWCGKFSSDEAKDGEN